MFHKMSIFALALCVFSATALAAEQGVDGRPTLPDAVSVPDVSPAMAAAEPAPPAPAASSPGAEGLQTQAPVLANRCDAPDPADCPAAPVSVPPIQAESRPVDVGVPSRVRIGKPAQRAVTESYNWAENPNAVPVRDAGGRVVFGFSESAPTIVCAPLRVCDIELQVGEAVLGAPHIGDAIRWKVAPAVSGTGEHAVTHLVVKPTEAGLDTNLIVPTDRRTYHLRLVSSVDHYVSSVAFDYPEDNRRAWEELLKAQQINDTTSVSEGQPTVAVNRLNFNYKIKVVRGKPSFKPLRAMDDGYHTYIAMNEDMPQREAPALIGISPSGAELMLNYRLKGNLYMVDGTQFKLALISGVGRHQERIELTRDPCRDRGWLGICWDPKED
jgi:type IV secretion system protein VirB9